MTQNKSKNTPDDKAAKELVTWENETIPRSLQFDDTYYSKADSYGETQYVFINGNRLQQRWPNMQTCTIAELGFGTGLNFLVTAIEWQKLTQKENSKLNFISFEQYPLSADEMAKALSRWPAITKEANKLVDMWRVALTDLSRQQNNPITIELSNNITLSVYLGDANEQLDLLRDNIDAWYLDGFSPVKNPKLWNEALMQKVAKNTVSKGTFATYTAASFVRKSLSAAGFTVERTKGYAGKRHMSMGTMI